MTKKEEVLMQRCFDLAKLGTGQVSPNPIVGAIISIPNKILGEGCHKFYGFGHAEVNAVKSVTKNNLKFLKKSTISVSLEPCNFHGNTPACTDLIIKKLIPEVNISTIDKTSKVNSKGISKLKDHGKKVQFGILEKKGRFVARARNTFVTKNRPYIILKYAQSLDGFIGKEGRQIWLTNSYTKRLVHKWRSEVSAIIVGTNTILSDDPKLTTRLYPGKSPIRITIDQNNKIPKNAAIKDGEVKTWIYTSNEEHAKNKSIEYRQIQDQSSVLHQICGDLLKENCNTLLVEGGSKLIEAFIKEDLWDEARILTSKKTLNTGIKAPSVNGQLIKTFAIDNDTLELIINPRNVIKS